MASEHARGSLNALPPGTVLRDYVIESELGSGGFSIVYLARHHLKSNWLYAIKEFLPAELAARAREGTGVRPLNTEARSAFEDGLRRFRDEAEQLRKFRNERYIVSCLNYFEENDTAYLVMDYDNGLPLSEFLRLREDAGQPFTEADLLAVVEPLLEGLTVVHRAGVLHRDIKPGNIFVRREDGITGRPAHPVLIDFGAAKQNYHARHSRSQAPYTPGYAAYEQVSSTGEIGPWTDVYALGALMWRMVAGGCPGDNSLIVPVGTDGEVDTGVWSPTPRPAEKRAYALHRGRPDPMVPAADLGSGRYSQQLLEAIDRCLALYPEDRVQSSAALGTLLGSDGTPMTAGMQAQGMADRRRNMPAAATERDRDPILKWVLAAIGGALTIVFVALMSFQPGFDSEQTQAPERNNSGVTYENTESVPADQSQTIDSYRRAAQLGNIEAQYNVGRIYYNGDGVPEDKAQAAEWFRQAAEQGHVRAQHALGVMNNQGDGVPEDKVLAALWFTLSAEQGYAPSQSSLGERYFQGEGVPQDYAQAVQWYTRAAVQDDAYAQYRLSHMYYNGTGVSKNDNQGFLWLTRAYEQGFYLAAPDLMIRYSEDFGGVPENTVQAVQWFTRAAEQGDSFAQHILGKMYADGMNVPEDDAQAVQWYTRSAEQGHAPSQYQLGDMYYNGEGVPQNYVRAVQWYTHAAERGIPGAQISLGRMYANGEGVPLDNVQAYAWTNLAGVDGLPDAVTLRDEIARRLSGTQLAEAQQLSLELDARIQSSR